MITFILHSGVSIIHVYSNATMTTAPCYFITSTKIIGYSFFIIMTKEVNAFLLYTG